MRLTLAVLLVSVVGLRAGQAPCASDYPDVESALIAVDKSSLPTDKFNSTCVVGACPGLSTIPCPLNPDNTTNGAVVSQILSSVQHCLSTAASICDTPINPIPLCSAGINISSSLATLPLSGFIQLIPRAGFITGINASRLTSGVDGAYITLTTPNYLFSAATRGRLGLGSSYLNISRVPVTLAINISLIMGLTLHPRASLDLVSSAVQAQLLFDESSDEPLVSTFYQVLEFEVQKTVQNLTFAADYFEFTSSILRDAIQSVLNTCSKH